MRVRLAYGTAGLDIDVDPDVTTVVEPQFQPAAADPAAALRAALREPVSGPPLRELVRPGQTVAISICDGTRAQPRHLMIPAVLEELDGIVRLERRRAPGRDRHPPGQQRRRTAGDARRRGVRAASGSSTMTPRAADSLAFAGVHGNGVPVWLNRRWLEADVRITTGFVEPHFFAGFSGGPKLVAPGLAGLDTVLVLHDAARIGHPRATWGVTDGNPVHDDVRAIAAATGVTFALDVILNREQGHRGGVRRRAVPDARRRLRGGAAHGDAAGPGAVRRGRDQQLRLPARPEPLPGGEGHVRGRARSHGPAARSSAPPSAATASPTTAPTARSSPRAVAAGTARRRSWPARRPSPTSGRSRSRRRSRPRDRVVMHTSLPHRLRPRRRAPGADSRRQRGRGRGARQGRARTPGCASCPRDRRPSPTSRPPFSRDHAGLPRPQSRLCLSASAPVFASGSLTGPACACTTRLAIIFSCPTGGDADEPSCPSRRRGCRRERRRDA